MALAKEVRDNACESSGGIVLSGAGLDPLMSAFSNILAQQSQQTKDMIPEKAIQLFERTRQVLSATQIDVCNDQAVQTLVHATEQVIARQFQFLEKALTRSCEEYQKFLQTDEGQALLTDLKIKVQEILQPEKEAGKGQ